MNHRRTLIFFLVLIFAVGAMGTAAANVQFDIGLNVPFLYGISFQDNDDIQKYSEYAFVIPDLKLNYFWGTDTLRIGAGARAFTAIVETLAIPIVTAELNMNPLRFTASLGGQAFLLFGIYNNIIFENIFVADVNAAYKVNDWFHVGAGATGLFLGDAELFQETIPYTAYAMVRFSIGD